MKQKTLRFYEYAEADMKALNKLKEYRNYGFCSSREMIIVAINAFGQEYKNTSIDISNSFMDDLAEKIANKLRNMDIVTASGDVKEEQNEEDARFDDNEAFREALHFMEAL